MLNNEGKGAIKPKRKLSGIAASPKDERPRERLLVPGSHALTDAELLAILLRIGGPIRFYEIDYAWKKGEHPKRGKFSPDFFIKVGDLILVVEIKGDEELHEPSEGNPKKNEYAIAHFMRVNQHLEEEGNPIRTKFNFLTEQSFNKFFQSLRDGNIEKFRSELDVKLTEGT